MIPERRNGQMKRLMAAVLLVLCLAGSVTAGAGAEVERNVLLDNAFKMLEEGNLFIERYNKLTGAEVVPILQCGVPYFFGGKDYDKIVKNLPRLGKSMCKETTTFYRKNKLYACGLDCHGYIYAVRSESGMVGLTPLNPLFSPVYTDKKTNKRYKWEDYYIWWKYDSNQKKSSRQDNPLPADLSTVKDTAEVGDLLIIHARGNHVLMYIGTLRDYGFTEEEVPALKDYLDYPLMIHCGISPVYGERIRKVLDEDPEYYKRVKTTNGGVQVSIWGVPREAAEYHETVQNNDFDYFKLPNGQVMTIYDFTKVSKWRWMRLPPDAPVLKERGGEEKKKN